MINDIIKFSLPNSSTERSLDKMIINEIPANEAKKLVPKTLIILLFKLFSLSKILKWSRKQYHLHKL